MPNIVCTIVEVCVFRLKNGQPHYLMLKRSNSEKVYPNAWQVVTGSIENNETALQASLRELKEETGFTPEHYWIVPHVNTFYSERSDTIHHTVIFAARVPNGVEPDLSEEHDEFAWCDLGESKKKLIWPGQVRALEVVHEYIVNGKESEMVSRIESTNRF